MEYWTYRYWPFRVYALRRMCWRVDLLRLEHAATWYGWAVGARR